MKRGSLVPLPLAILFIVFIPIREFQFIGILIVGIYTTSALIFFVSRNSFRAYRDSKIQYCQNGNGDRVNIYIKNRSPFTLSSIEISDKGGGCYSVEEGTYNSTFKPGETKLFSTPVSNEKRGKHRVGPVVIKGCDPFRLFPWSKTLNEYIDIVIYPKLYPLETLLTSGEVGGALNVSDPVFLDSSSLKGIRKYIPGDPIKSINWKATAKSGKLHVMEFNNTKETPIFVLLDIDKNNYPNRYRYQFIERSIETAASLIVSNGTKNQPCGLFIRSEKGRCNLPISSGEAHIVAILETLSTLDFDNRDNTTLLESFLELGYNIPQSCSVYIISPDLKVNKHGISLLMKRGYSITRITTGGSEEESDLRVDLYNREDISVKSSNY